MGTSKTSRSNAFLRAALVVSPWLATACGGGESGGAAAEGGTTSRPLPDAALHDSAPPSPSPNDAAAPPQPPNDAAAPLPPPADAFAGAGGAPADAGPAPAADGRVASDGAVARPDAGPQGPAPTFRRLTVDAAAAGPAYVEVVDLDGDHQPELVASHLGVFLGFAVPDGQVTVYRRPAGGGLDRWEKAQINAPADGLRFPGQVTAADVDGDGDPDLIVPSGFLLCQVVPGGGPCGGLGWYEQTADGFVHHDVVPIGASLFYHHVEWVDFDGDGRRDLVTVGEEKQPGFGETPERAETQWYRGVDGPDRFERVSRVVGAGLGSFPRVRDLDGDGDLDVAGAEFFASDASFAWFERTAEPTANAPAGTFVRHVIDDTSGPSIMFRLVDDLYGDGRLFGVGTNHTNTQKLPPDAWHEGLFAFEVPADPREAWQKTVLSEDFHAAVNLLAPQAAPGIFDAGDIDGDGDVDLLVAGDGDPRVQWFEQRAPGQFEAHLLADRLGQAGGARIADLDGDGQNELVVTAYEANAIYVFVRE